jgi:hypothetical protein
MPIYHPNTDIQWYKKYLAKTDYVGIGAIAKLSGKRRMQCLDRLWSTYLVDDKSMPAYRIHGMGITSFELMARYPWFSVDSTSWIRTGMYGSLYIPQRINGQWCYSKTPRVLSFSTGSPSAKEKDKHITTVSPATKTLLLAYLKELGVAYGKTKVVDGKEVVVEVGVSNHYVVRDNANLIFYDKFVQTLVWPRPFEVKRTKGFLE